MWKTGKDFPRSVWEYNVALVAAQKNSADTNSNKAFYIKYNYIPEEACIELATKDWSNAQVDMMRVSIMTKNKVFIPPVSLDNAVKFCAGLTSMEFYFEVDTATDPWKSYLDGTKEMR